MTDQVEQLTEQLANQAVEAAAKGLGAYLRDRGHDTKKINWDALTGRLRLEVKAALPEALEDAKEAVRCGMGGYAVPTFRSSMVVAGANAGKKYFGEIA